MRFTTLCQTFAIGLIQDRRLLTASLLSIIASTSSAVDYSAGANMDVNASHDNNLRMVERDKTEVYKYAVSPTFTFGANTETTKLDLTSALDFFRYDKSEFNSDDQNIALSLSHQFEDSSIALRAGLIRNSTITSELLTTGVVGSKAERTEQYRLAPSWQYSLNETNLIQISGSHVIQDYHSTSYTGYKNSSGEFDWIHIINERLKLVTAATYSDYHSDEIKFDVPGRSFNTIDLATNVQTTYEVGHFGQQSYSTRTKDKGVQLGLDYQWSEQSLIQARLGRSKNDTTYPVKDSRNICADPTYLKLIGAGFQSFVGGICEDIPSQSTKLSTAEIDWTWTTERQQFTLTGTKSTQPTSNGYTVDALQLNTNWTYELTELDQLYSNITVVRNRARNASTIQNTSIADRDYGSATLQFRHRIGDSWFLHASYQFNKNKYTQINYEANSNVISLGIRYQPREWHWSR